MPIFHAKERVHMVLKITELRKQYGVFPEFETEEEQAAYEEANEKAYAERVAEEVAKLKALYASNPTKYSKFKNFTEADWKKYADLCLKTQKSRTNANSYIGLTPTDLKPENAEWIKFTYEEIIAMEATGVFIPDEVLAWAHSMQDSDVTAYEITDEETTEDTSVDSENSELEKMKKETLKLSSQSQKAQEEANLKFQELEENSKKAEKIKREQETTQKDSLAKIDKLTKEYDELAQKAKKGEKLDDGEKKRYQELGLMLNGKDGELVTDVQASSDELQELINSMDGLNNDIQDNVKLGSETTDAATQLAMYEHGYNDKNTVPNFFVNVSTGLIRDMLYGAQGQSVARDALDNGNNLIEFSNTLNDTLMMNQYASLYEFATTFTESAAETINQTKDVMGEDFNKSSEEIEEESDVEVSEESADDLDMSQLTTMGLGTRQLTAKVQKVGQDSAKLGEEALKELKKINKKQAELAREKENLVQEQEESAAETSETDSKEPVKAEEAAQGKTNETENETSATEQESLAAETEAVDGEIKTQNSKGLTAKEKLQKSLKTNEKYNKFDTQADNVMDTTTNVGVVSTAYGTILIANGVQMIAAGVPLLSNIFTYFAGMALVMQGTYTLTAGVGFTAIGADLISIGTEGVEACDITGEQIDLSNETIQSVLETIEEQDGVEKEQLTAAQSERADMQAAGVSLPDQARHFRDKSNDETAQSVKSIIETKLAKSESAKEAKTSEAVAKIIEHKMKGKKAEYDELKAKEERAQEKSDEAKEAAKNPQKAQNLQQSEEEFTEQDKNKMDKLGNELKNVGDKGQQKLYNSLVKINGLEEFLADKDEIALESIDYGDVTQVVGQDLYDSAKGNILMIFKLLLALSTKHAGERAENTGNTLNEFAAQTIEANNANRARIEASQTKIEEVTMSAALSPNASQDGEEEAKEQEADTPESSAEPKQKLTGAAAIVASMGVGKGVENAKANAAGMPQPEKSEKKEKQEEEMTTESAQNSVDSMQKATEEENADSLAKKADTEKTEEQLTKEMKTLQKQMKKDQKEIIKMTQDALKIAQEKQEMAEEFELLQAQNETIVENQQSQQNSAPMAAAPSNDQQQGGLLAPQAGAAQQSQQGNEASTLEANQSRMAVIAGKFQTYDRKLTTYNTKIKRLSTINKTRNKKFEKLAKAKTKVIKENQKVEAAKQAKVQKTLAAVAILNNLFSITLSIGMILAVIAKTPWGAWAEAPSQLMIKIGTYGLAACAVLKSTILMANGNFQAAFMTLGMAAIQIATSLIPGVGAAAGTVTSAIGAGLNVVSASLDTAAQIQTLAGKEQSGWLNTASQITGIAGGLTNVAGSLSQGLGSGLDAATKIVGAVGTVASSTAQISALIKQSQGKETGSFENIMGIIGGSLQMAAAAMALGSQISGGSKNNTKQNNDNKAVETQETTTQDTTVTENTPQETQTPETQEAAQAVVAQAGNIDGALSATEIAQNPTAAEAKIDAQIEQAQQAIAETKVDAQTSQEIANYNPENETYTDENGIERKQFEPIISEETQAKVDKDLGIKSIEEMRAEMDPSKDIQPIKVVNKAQQRFERQQKMQKAQEIMGSVGQVAQGGMQMAQAISSLSKDEDITEQKKNVLHLSNMKKGKALMKKVKQRRQASKHNNKYYA